MEYDYLSMIVALFASLGCLFGFLLAYGTDSRAEPVWDEDPAAVRERMVKNYRNNDPSVF